MAKFRIVSDVFSPPEWEFQDDKGQTVKLVSSYFEVIEVGKQDPAEKVFLHQKPSSDPLKEGDELEGTITSKTNKKGTHKKFEKDKKFPPLRCPNCGTEGPLEDFKQAAVPNRPGGSKNSQTHNGAPQADKPVTGDSVASQGGSDDDSEPPLENYDEILG